MQEKKQDLSQKMYEIDDVKRQYQAALSNIQRLEAQVLDKLQERDVEIE